MRKILYVIFLIFSMTGCGKIKFAEKYDLLYKKGSMESYTGSVVNILDEVKEEKEYKDGKKMVCIKHTI